MNRYIEKRNIGKLNSEIFDFAWDLNCGLNCYQSKVNILERKIHRIKNKKQLLEWHQHRIKKYSEKLRLSMEQDDFIEELLNVNTKSPTIKTTDVIKKLNKEFKIFPLFSMIVYGLNGIEWGLIIICCLAYLITNNYII